MEDRLARLESQVEGLVRAVADLEGRLASIEGARGREGDWREGGVRPAVEAPGAPEADVARPGGDFIGHLALAGRALLALAGAYLLRALTEGGALRPAVGVALGLAYAFAWLFLADRAASRRRVAGAAAVYAAVAAVIAYPLVWEAATRFGVLSAPAAAAVLTLFAGAGLAVSWRHRLRAVAWVAVVGAIAAAWAMAVWEIQEAHGAILPFVAAQILLGVAVVEFSHHRPTPGLRWIAAGAADAAVLVLGIRAAFGRGVETPGWVTAAQLALVVAFVGATVVRSLRPGWKSSAFDVVQTLAALAVGYGGAIRLLHPAGGAGAEGGTGAVALGIASLVVAGALFAAATPLLGKRAAWRHTFLYFPSLAFAFLLGGTTLLLPPTGRALAWSALALVAVAMAVRFGSVTLALFSAVYAAAGAAASGLLAAATAAFWAAADRPLPAIIGVDLGVDLAVLAAVLIACAIPFPRESAWWRRAAGVPKALFLALAAWAGGGAVLLAVASGFARPAEGGGGTVVDPALLAALRTATLAATAVALGWATRWPRVREAGWLVYPVLLAGGIKLLWEDFPLARPAELFAALALYGAALIAAPRLARRRQG